MILAANIVIIVSCVLYILYLVFLEKIRFVDRRKSVMENFSHFAIVLTLVYGIFQYSYYVWPVWEKQNDLDQLKLTVELKTQDLKKLTDEISVQKIDLEDLKTQRDLYAERNNQLQEVLASQRKQLSETLGQLGSLKSEKQTTENELYYSYTQFFINGVFNKFLVEYVTKENEFNLKKEIIKYIESAKDDSTMSQQKRSALVSFSKFAETLKGNESWKALFEYQLQVAIEISKRD